MEDIQITNMAHLEVLQIYFDNFLHFFQTCYLHI